MTLNKHIEEAITNYLETFLQAKFSAARVVKGVVIEDGKAIVDIELGFPIAGIEENLQRDITALITKISDVSDITLNIKQIIKSHAVQTGVAGLPNVKNIIAIASGKGGVGKSTVAANLALALQQEGARVGVLDADIYGPSQPHMLGATTSPEIVDNKLKPVICHGIQTMSIAYLIESEDTAMIWRGPIISKTLQQLLQDTLWDNLDYLIIDLPPGTGDIQLTLAQKIPVSGAVIVTTPQDIALLDARKAFRMFEKVKIPVLGIIENMSVHVCSQCGHQDYIFSQKGGAKMAAQYQLDLLASLPLSRDICLQTDSGNPTVIAAPESTVAQSYRDVARKVAIKLSLQSINYAMKFPKIVIQST